MAKAIAGESGVPFLSIAASEFVELFVGVGASRVRDLFTKAKENPCIIFIDEIDSIACQRGSGVGGGNDEREQTLNQLLTELDGFADNSGIIVLAATNRPDILDSALLRPGRFDRKIEVMLPDLDGRKKSYQFILFQNHFQAKLTWDIGSRTVGFSGADLANLMNESAIHCARSESKLISDFLIENALDKLLIENFNNFIQYEKNYCLQRSRMSNCTAVWNGIESVDKIQSYLDLALRRIYQNCPRWRCNFADWFQKFLLSKIEIALVGRAAETIVFGKSGNYTMLDKQYFLWQI